MKRSNVAAAFAVVAALVVLAYYAHTLAQRFSPSLEKSGQANSPAIQPHRLGPIDIYPPAWATGAVNADIRQDNINENICNSGWSTKSERPPASYTTRLKIQQLQDLGYSDRDTSDYEEDHLISLELGGSPTSIVNLWPEPYDASIADGGARFKDKVENFLHAQVCAGTITLEQAQIAIVKDWYAVYKGVKF